MAFHEDRPEVVRRRLTVFDERDWMRTRRWLHTSGMALYFLDRMRRLGAEDAILPRWRGSSTSIWRRTAYARQTCSKSLCG